MSNSLQHLDRNDAKHWEDVEEATEVLLEGRYEEGLSLLRDTIKKDPSNPYAYHYAATALYELGQLEPARDAYRAAFRISPDYDGARIGLSNVLRLLGDCDGAIREAQVVLRKSPKDVDALHAAALAYAAKGKRQLSKEHLQRVLDSDPEAEARIEVQQILETLGLGEEGDPVQFE